MLLSAEDPFKIRQGFPRVLLALNIMTSFLHFAPSKIFIFTLENQKDSSLMLSGAMRHFQVKFEWKKKEQRTRHCSLFLTFPKGKSSKTKPIIYFSLASGVKKPKHYLYP